MIEGVSLIIEGGGMRGFYSAGILRRLLDEGLVFPYVIGVSSGALCATAYAADGLEPNFAALPSSGMVGFINPRGFVRPLEGILRTRPLLDALMGDSCGGARSYPGKVLVSATEATTGELAWWQASQCASAEQWRACVTASASIPFLMPQARVDGRVYADGGIRDSIPVDRALADGMHKHVLILSRPRTYRKGAQHLELYLRHVLRAYPKLKEAMLKRHLYYNESMELVERLEDEGCAFVFRPAQTRVGRFEMAPAKLEADYRSGYEAAGKQMDALRSFLGQELAC